MTDDIDRTPPVIPTDWRGVKILGGSTVIYGAGVGRSISPTEAVVESRPGYAAWYPRVTESGNVWVRVVRRAYGGSNGSGARSRVHVMAERLTVVGSLPASEKPTEEEKTLLECRRAIVRHSDDIADIETNGYDPTYGGQHQCYSGCRHWTDEEALAYHRGEIRKAERKLKELGAA